MDVSCGVTFLKNIVRNFNRSFYQPYEQQSFFGFLSDAKTPLLISPLGVVGL